jgi:two-component system, OmpR family, KDP operon response regulator KdpE
MSSHPIRILVVDDEAQMLQMLRLVLTGSGYKVLTAATGEEALDQLAVEQPDLVILDLMLPDISGVEVTRQVRSWPSSVPIIILSALGEERDKVAALDAGADDYLTKPFSTQELLARVRVWLRRLTAAPAPAASSIIQHGELMIDLARRTVTRASQPIYLTPKEYDMLTYLAKNAGRVVTHRTLLTAVWGAEYTGSPQYLHVLINHLRRKIEPDPQRPQYILTEPGIGYRFAEG